MNKMSVAEAAKKINATEQFVREALKANLFPWGVAVKMPGGRFSYWISEEKLDKWLQE